MTHENQHKAVEHKTGVVLRVGELFLKGKNRFMFEDAMERNLRRVIKDREDLVVKKAHGRFFVLGASDEDLISRLQWLFGISSYSPVVFCEKNMDAITQTAVDLAEQSPYAGPTATFRIAPHRADKNFKHISTEIGRIAGAAVAVKTGMGVDLEKPNLSIGVEIGKNWTFCWTERFPGGGGLPVGTSGRIGLLLSGGIDSPVAGHLLQKRGMELTGIYFHAFPYTGDGAKQKVINLAAVLAKRQRKLNLYVVPFTAVQEHIREHANPTYLVLLYRRAMIRIAEQLMKQNKIIALSTGESLGQVASQTIANLSCVQDAATLPIIRPLITYDKFETINIARSIGTYEISILPHDDCCTLFVPKHPETNGKAQKAQEMEAAMDLDDIIKKAVEEVELVKL